MTLQVGDKAILIPVRGGGRVAIRSGTISVGDRVILVTGVNGQRYAVKPASPQVGDKVILYPLRNGGYACLFPAGAEGAEGEPSHPVMPPANFHAVRTGPSTADLDWFPGEGNTAVRIVRRSDRYPTTIRDGTIAYEGGGDEVEDTGLDYRLPYYYCAWGKEGSKYSNGYLTEQIGASGEQIEEIFGPEQLTCSGNYSQTTGHVWLYSGGSYALVSSTIKCDYINVEFLGDYNDGVAKIYIDGALVEEFCTWNYWETREYQVSYAKHTIQIVCKGARCGGSDVHVAVNRVIFETR